MSSPISTACMIDANYAEEAILEKRGEEVIKGRMPWDTFESQGMFEFGTRVINLRNAIWHDAF